MADITIFQAKTNTTILMLTNDEERMAVECTMFTEIKIQQELERFNANRNICISHHKYLQNTNSFVVVVGGTYFKLPFFVYFNILINATSLLFN
jgi:ABC-type antimicrobial peptide transport system ATPase subunit